MRRWQADLTLGMVALIWGSTFVVVQNALDAVGPLTFVAFRFIVGSALLTALFFRRVRQITRQDLLSGGLLGLWLALGYIFQTIGLQSTTSAKAGFITGLSVVIVPVLATALLRRPPGRGPVIGIVAATIGLGFLSLNRDLSIQSGDLWVLGCALAFAMHITSVAYFSPRHDSIRLSLAQIAAVAVLAMGGAAGFETPTLDLPVRVWGAILFTGALATALAYGLQVYVQRFTTPTHTALLFSLEPVFAAFFGWWWSQEVLGAKELVGCGLILTGMIVAELGDPREVESTTQPIPAQALAAAPKGENRPC
jgi:drug/metabolite transporter (DMT)-like permease